MELFILAGGKGTRVAHILGQTPKAMADVGGEPFLVHQLRHAAKQGILDIVLCLGTGHAKVAAHIGDGSQFSVRVRHSVEPRPLGTAGAVRWALRHTDGAFLVLNGDTWLDAPWKSLIAKHTSGMHMATMAAIEVSDTGRFGSLDIAPDGRVT